MMIIIKYISQSSGADRTSAGDGLECSEGRINPGKSPPDPAGQRSYPGPCPNPYALVRMCPSHHLTSLVYISLSGQELLPWKPSICFLARWCPKPACCSDITALSWELLLGGWLGSLQKPCCSKNPSLCQGACQGRPGNMKFLVVCEGWKQLNGFIGSRQALVILAWETQVLYISLSFLPSSPVTKVGIKTGLCRTVSTDTNQGSLLTRGDWGWNYCGICGHSVLLGASWHRLQSNSCWALSEG